METRRMTWSGAADASQDHFAVAKVDPLTDRPVDSGTRKPVPGGRAGKSLRAKAKVTKAMLAYGTTLNVAAARGTTGRSSRAAGAPGTARMTAETSWAASLAAEPTVSRHPEPRRERPRTVAPVRTDAPLASATAGASAASPPDKPKNAGGRLRLGSGSSSAAAASSEEPLRTRAKRSGRAASNEIWSACPA